MAEEEEAENAVKCIRNYTFHANFFLQIELGFKLQSPPIPTLEMLCVDLLQKEALK